MKCKFLISFALIICILSSCSRKPTPDPAPVETLAAGWRKIAIPTEDFSDIFFINNTGYTVGGGKIYRSTDGGNNWQKVYHSATSFMNIGMGSESNIAFVGYSNKIIFTKNGGASFDSVTINDQLNDIYFVNATTAYGIGNSFWKTTNAGSTWTKLYDFTPSIYRSLYFLNEMNGWMAGSGGVVFKTTNGGLNWEQKTVGSDLDFSTGNVFFVDQNNGYVTDDTRIAKTTNGGSSWSKVFTATSGFVDLHFISADVGYITAGGSVHKTINGGATWTKELALTNIALYEVHFTDSNHGWACGGGGVLKFEK